MRSTLPLFVALAIVLGCADVPGVPLGRAEALADRPTRGDLMRALYRADTLVVALPAAHPGLEEAFRAGPMAGGRGQPQPVRFVPAHELTATQRRGPLVWLHVADRRAAAPRTAPPTSLIEIVPDGFAFGGVRYAERADVAMLLVPNEASGADAQPLGVYIGGSAEALADALRRQRRLDPDTGSYTVHRAGRLQRTGFFDAAWRYADALDRSLAGADAVRLARDTIVLRGAVTSDETEVVHARLAALRARVAHRAGADAAPLDATLFAHNEEYGLWSIGPARAQASGPASDTIRIALPRYPGAPPLAFDAEFQIARTLLRAHLGDPATPALIDGAALALAGSLYGTALETLAGRLAQAPGSAPTLATLLDREAYATLPPLVRWGYAGALADWLDEVATDSLAERWAQRLTPSRALETRWRQHLVRLAQRTAPTLRRDLPDVEFSGFNFAHQGYRVLDGYGSRLADTELARIAGLGGTAVAIIPYTSMRDPAVPVPLYVSQSPGGESDRPVLHTTLAAQATGLRTVMKPQIWLRGSWPGDIAMQSEAEWDAFFAHYTRWIQHYAILAEAAGADVLCLGVELGKATLAHPERWRQLAQSTRALFGGDLTYAANWGDEFERIAFWDALDIIGLDQYYPLATDSAATDEALRAGAERIVAVMNAVQARERKPILLTEVGYPSRPAPWINPHADGRREPYAPEDQARAIRIFADALRGSNDLAGALWWKWPTNPEASGPGHTGFTPRGKPAEAVLRQSFAQ